METIQIDFDVYKELTIRRATADVTYNDVLREMLGLSPVEGARQASSGKAWVVKGIRFPDGTEFRARYKGKEYRACVDGTVMEFNGEQFKSPSAAAIAITGNNVNGWKFWEVRRPGEKQWRLMFSVWKDEGDNP